MRKDHFPAKIFLAILFIGSVISVSPILVPTTLASVTCQYIPRDSEGMVIGPGYPGYVEIRPGSITAPWLKTLDSPERCNTQCEAALSGCGRNIPEHCDPRRSICESRSDSTGVCTCCNEDKATSPMVKELCDDFCGGTPERKGVKTFGDETFSCPTAPAAPTSTGPTPYQFESITPRLEIPLPTLPSLSQFTDITIQGDAPNRYLLIPWIGQYIAAIYKYAIGIVGILSGIMIVVGGLLWLTAGGAADRISTAKSFIESSLVGLVIALTSYLLLYAINPKLTEFDSLRVRYIERVETPGASSAASLAEDLPPEALTSGNHSAFISPEQYKLATGKDMPSKSDIILMMDRIAQEKGIDKCLLDAIVAKESGYKPNRLGHDEDVSRTQVGSRRKFIDSGKKSSGTTFTPNSDLYTQSFPNDDVFAPQNPPNFGLDPRFTHGIGLGQMTIIDEDHNGEMDRCPDGNLGREVGNTCLNVLELFDAEKTLAASADLIKKKLARFGSVERLFYRYAGGGCSARVSQCKKMQAYAECKGDSNLASKERSDCSSWLQEQNDNCDNKDFR